MTDLERLRKHLERVDEARRLIGEIVYSVDNCALSGSVFNRLDDLSTLFVLRLRRVEIRERKGGGK